MAIDIPAERPGEVITREELRKNLWPSHTFVDFDEGLNTAIKKLRYALGDSPDNPTFIVGYAAGARVSGDIPGLLLALKLQYAAYCA